MKVNSQSSGKVSFQNSSDNVWMRRFSKLLCLSTLFLIFLGGLVKSTESGLSVPDWPTTYGHFMFSFPLSQMVGGIKYEHTHRMVASVVGLFTLILAIWMGFKESRRWLKNLGFIALFAVILQGVLGGITVLLYLPDAISIAHGVLAQLFFILTIIIAYSLSIERSKREGIIEKHNSTLVKINLYCSFLIFAQLILGAWVRHTESGLAIPDFPTIGGQWIPIFNQEMLNWINLWRFDHNFDPVTIQQVIIHFTHRLMALIIVIFILILNVKGAFDFTKNIQAKRAVVLLNLCIITQVMLGIFTVLSGKDPIITSFHVLIGALTLGVSILLLLRISPLPWKEFRKKVL